LVDPLPRFQGRDIIQRQITRKWYKIELYLQRQANSKLYMIYRTALFSATLNDPYLDFKVTPLFDAKFLKRYEILT